MKKRDERMHSMLDGEIPVGKSSASMESDPEKLSVYRERLRLLEEFEGNAPDDFVGRVMAGLPDSADRKWYDRKWALWPGRGLWAVPTFVGAVGMMLIIFGIGLLYGGGAEDLVAVHFDVYAPSAKKVEMVGTFSGWMPGKIALKGPDSIGYWGCSVKLHPGRYEYLFLIDGAKLVPDGGTAARCPDGFGSQNSLVLVKDEGSFWRRHFQSATAEGAQTPDVSSREVALCLPNGQRTRWEGILDRGIGAGLGRIRLERILARLAASKISPEKAEIIFGPLFAHIRAGEHAKQVLLEIEEGILKGVPFGALVHSVLNKDDLFLKARKGLLKTDPDAAPELCSELEASFVADMERGLSEEFLLETVAKGIKVHPNRTKYLLDAVQLLHDAGLKEQELKVFVQNCFEKNLGMEEIDSSVYHIMEKLREGVDGKTICQGLRV